MRKLKIFIFSFLITTSIIFLYIFYYNPYTIDITFKKKYNITIDKNLERKLKLVLYKKNHTIREIIFGSSRTTILNTESISDNCFNFSFSGAALDEILYLLKNEIDLKSLKEVYLGLDEFMFDYSNKLFEEDMNFLYNQNMYNTTEYFYSFDILLDIYRVNKSEINYIYDLKGNKIRRNINIPSKNSIAKYIKKRADEINKGLHKFDYSKVVVLYKIIDFLNQKQIKINLFINPISKELRDFYIKNNSEYERYISYLKNMQYINFNYDNEITKNIFKYYMDPHHYRKEVGQYMINFMRGKKERLLNFGRYNE